MVVTFFALCVAFAERIGHQFAAGREQSSASGR
jgi:hypothetical protein